MKKIFRQRGYIILFTILVVSVILAMALGIMNVTTREQGFSIASRESHIALFAADSGGECALYYYNNPNGNPFKQAAPNPTDVIMDCTGVPTQPTSNSLPTTSSNPSFQFDYEIDLPLANGCAFVSIITNQDNPGGSGLSDRRDIIRSRGYNVPCDQVSGPNASPRRVERLLEYTYDYTE